MKKILFILALFPPLQVAAEMRYNLETERFYTTHGTDQITGFMYDTFVRIFSNYYWENIKDKIPEKKSFLQAKKQMYKLIGTDCAGCRVFLSDLEVVQSYKELIDMTAAPDYSPQN